MTSPTHSSAIISGSDRIVCDHSRPRGIVWDALQSEAHLDTNDNQGKRKWFDPRAGLVDILVKAYQQAGHWQTKRQILSLFADDFLRSELLVH